MNELILNFLFAILAFLLVITVSRMFMYIGTYFFIKTNCLVLDSERSNIETIRNRTDNTTDVLNIIRILIENEISVVLSHYIQLHETYNLMKFDEDSNKIGTAVYEALNKDIFIKNNTILTPDYIQKYIIHESIYLFLNTINTHNASLRNMIDIKMTEK